MLPDLEDVLFLLIWKEVRVRGARRRDRRQKSSACLVGVSPCDSRLLVSRLQPAPLQQQREREREGREEKVDGEMIGMQRRRK